MILWIGIDDTDNLDSRGTGYIARSLAKNLRENGFGSCLGISRHQLLVDPAIPYTSHNSSLCLEWQSERENTGEIILFSSQFLQDNCADGSDPGLCIVPEIRINPFLIKFSKEAKVKVLKKSRAIHLAKQFNLFLSELGGTGGGVIGALAAVGLASDGNDGRYVWVQGIREMEGIFSARDILNRTGVKVIQTIQGELCQEEDLVEIGEWFRPVLLSHKPTLLIEPSNNPASRWKIVDREIIKSNY